MLPTTCGNTWLISPACMQSSATTHRSPWVYQTCRPTFILGNLVRSASPLKHQNSGVLPIGMTHGPDSGALPIDKTHGTDSGALPIDMTHSTGSGALPLDGAEPGLRCVAHGCDAQRRLRCISHRDGAQPSLSAGSPWHLQALLRSAMHQRA